MNQEPTKTIQIFLADDDIDDCDFFKRALSALTIPAELTIVHDGEKLMDALNNTAEVVPNVIFLDINMPRKNGYECLAELKQSSRLKDIPVIMFSTTNSRDAVTALFKIGADVYVRKPGDFEDLKNLIRYAVPMATEKLFSNSQLKYILNA